MIRDTIFIFTGLRLSLILFLIKNEIRKCNFLVQRDSERLLTIKTRSKNYFCIFKKNTYSHYLNSLMEHSKMHKLKISCS